MDTLPHVPLLGVLLLALLWSALFTAVDAARQQLILSRSSDATPPTLPSQAVVLCATLGKLLVLGLACLLGQQYNGEHGFWMAGISAAAALLVFAEYLPRRMARRHAQACVSLGASSLKLPLAILQPFAWMLDGCARLILRPFRAQPQASALHAPDADPFDEDLPPEPARSSLIEGLKALERITVNDILIPRNEVDGINLDDPIEQITEQLRVSRHTRLPVFHADINQVEAVLNTKLVSHLLPRSELSKENLLAACHEPYFIPETTPLQLQLLNFHKQQRRLGVVVDEYGEMLGIVTLEDILEEIVGEFEEEQSLDNPHVAPQADGRFLIEGIASLREINRSLGWHLPCDGGPKTLNGLVTEALESIPETAVCLKVGRYRLEILEIEDNCASKVLVWNVSR